MRLVQGRVRSRILTGPLAGFAGLLVLLGVLAAVIGLDVADWVTGVVSGAGLAALLARALAHHRRDGLGPADRVTLARAVLACGVAALTADSFGGQAPVAILVTLSTIALVLDGVDGQIARRTGTASAFGARFDMEVDALLILALSMLAWRFDKAGVWVIASGAMRYAFVAAGLCWRWLEAPLPPSRRRKTVCVVQLAALTIILLPVVTPPLSTAIAAGALAALTGSFLVDTLWLWQRAA